jgi:hypothetical protein
MVTKAPIDMPATSLNLDFFNTTGGPVGGSVVANWQTYSSTQAVAYANNYYDAGVAGFPAGMAVIQDQGRASFYSTLFYPAPNYTQAFALLPYRVSSGGPSQKVTASASAHPLAGKETYVRVVPQFDESGVSVGFKWYFDGRRLLDSVQSRPLNPVYWTQRWFRAKGVSAGTHTWQVDMTYGTIPPLTTKTLTWTQRWY